MSPLVARQRNFRAICAGPARCEHRREKRGSGLAFWLLFGGAKSNSPTGETKPWQTNHIIRSTSSGRTGNKRFAGLRAGSPACAEDDGIREASVRGEFTWIGINLGAVNRCPTVYGFSNPNVRAVAPRCASTNLIAFAPAASRAAASSIHANTASNAPSACATRTAAPAATASSAAC